MDWEIRWQKRVGAVTEAFTALPAAGRKLLKGQALELLSLKEEMQSLVSGVDAGTLCAACGGACCVAGRYHFTAVDLLVYLATGRPLFAPRFDSGLCPYLGEPGCLMPAGYRPFNCITFNCDAIEDLLPPEEVARFYQMERELRLKYRDLGALLPVEVSAGPLL